MRRSSRRDSRLRLALLLRFHEAYVDTTATDPRRRADAESCTSAPILNLHAVEERSDLNAGPDSANRSNERPRVVIAGGGFAALEALIALRRLAGHRVDLALVSPEPQLSYRPLAVVEPFGLGDAPRFELAEIARDHDAELYIDAAASVDSEGRVLVTQSGRELSFDWLLVTTGAQPVQAVPGALTYRGAPDRVAFEELLADIESGDVRRVAFAIPTGAAWPLPLYELALMTARPREHSGRAGRIHPRDGGDRAAGVVRPPGKRGPRGAAAGPLHCATDSPRAGLFRERRAVHGARGCGRGRPRGRPATPARERARRAADQQRRVRARGPHGACARHRPRVCRRRCHRLPDQAGRDRDAAGRRGRPRDRHRGRRTGHGGGLSAGPARPAADWRGRALPALRGHGRRAATRRSAGGCCGGPR